MASPTRIGKGATLPRYSLDELVSMGHEPIGTRQSRKFTANPSTTNKMRSGAKEARGMGKARNPVEMAPEERRYNR